MVKKLEIQSISQGIVLPFSVDNRGGVCFSNGDFIENSKYEGDWLKLGGKYSFDAEKCIDCSEKVIFLGFCVEHWGHFLVDCLGRLWILCDERFKDYKLIFLTKRGRKLQGNFLEFFSLLGIDSKRFIYLERPMKFPEVVIPECCYLHRSENERYRDVFDKIVERFQLKNLVPEKVYFSRLHLKKARKTELGELEIQQQFSQNGYEVFYPETLSLSRQLEIFQGAKSIACVNGTIPLNCLFAKSSIELIVLNKMSLEHVNLKRVSRLMGISPILVDCFYEPIHGHPCAMGDGPFWLQFNENLKSFFYERNWKCEKVKKHPFYGIVYRIMWLREHFLRFFLSFMRRMRNAIYRCVKRN